MSGKKYWSFSWYSNFLRCTCSYHVVFQIHTIKYVLPIWIIWPSCIARKWNTDSAPFTSELYYIVHIHILMVHILMVTHQACFLSYIPAFILRDGCVFGSCWNGQSFPFAVLSAVCLPQIHKLRYLYRKQNWRGAVLLKSIPSLFLKASSKQVIPFGKVTATEFVVCYVSLGIRLEIERWHSHTLAL